MGFRVNYGHISRNVPVTPVCHANSKWLPRRYGRVCVQDALPEECADAISAHYMQRHGEAFTFLTLGR
jgi:hypothetical protein